MNTFTFAAIVGSVLLSVSAAPAIAESVSVKIHPDELTTSHGRSAAINRIKLAAARLCNVGVSVETHQLQWRCEKQVIEQMVRQAQSPELLAQWQGEGANHAVLRI